MQNLKILSKKEIKKILKQLEYYGFKKSLDYVFLKNNESKIFIVSRKFGDINPDKLRINNLGLYFGKIEKNGIRLSIEGCQLIKPNKNVLEIGKKQLKQWMHGKDFEIKDNLDGFMALRHKKDYIGCGYAKNSKILNYVSKGRRLTTKIID